MPTPPPPDDRTIADGSGSHSPAEPHPSGGATDDGGGERIGPFRILKELGTGGMGVVYAAEQSEPVRRRVALKVIKLGMDSAEVLRRFEQERQALAVMSHDAIAKVLDAGTTERGQPWFAMELVEGQPLTDYCDAHQLSVRERIEVFQRICAGVQHAHQKGVIHRDLKPANILVAGQNGQHAVKIIDFGIARATGQELLEQSLLTEQGQLLGTPEYMSPEQASGDIAHLDTRTDVYALGVILYQLLSGKLPFPWERLRAAGFLEIQRVLSEEDPPKPSTQVTQSTEDARKAAATRGASTTELGRRLRGDLDWVVLKALAREPERRYGSPDALAEDLSRYLTLQPVQAGPPSMSYRLGKYWARNRLAVTAATAVLGAILVGSALAVQSAREARTQARRATEQERIALARAAEIDRQRQDLQIRDERFSQLAVVQRLRKLQAELHGLWPETPGQWPAVAARAGAWLERATELAAEEGQLREAITGLQARALPPEDGTGEPRFTDATEAFLHDTLNAALPQLKVFADLFVAEAAMRKDWGGNVRGMTVDNHLERWRRAREAIYRADGETASTLYGAEHSRYHPIDLQPQTGLIPLGMNPSTGLWEFLHLRSGWAAVHPKTGNANPARLAAELPVPEFTRQPGRKPVPPATGVPADWIGLMEYAEIESAPEELLGCGTGIILVLIPGGRCHLGAQAGDPTAPNHDPHATPVEGPVAAIDLAPFFIARHEITIGQWARLLGPRAMTPLWQGTDLQEVRPDSSLYGVHMGRLEGMVEPVDSTYPQSDVSWLAADSLFRLWGLRLPTEAQWEWAARGGTDTPHWTGREIRLLGPDSGGIPAINTLDRRTSAYAPFGAALVPWDDGYVLHAAADAMRPNPFGLHHVHGNLWEWCADVFAEYAVGLLPETGELDSVRDTDPRLARKNRRSIRGGGYIEQPSSLRVTVRMDNAPTGMDHQLGLRAARVLER